MISVRTSPAPEPPMVELVYQTAPDLPSADPPLESEAVAIAEPEVALSLLPETDDATELPAAPLSREVLTEPLEASPPATSDPAVATSPSPSASLPHPPPAPITPRHAAAVRAPATRDHARTAVSQPAAKSDQSVDASSTATAAQQQATLEGRVRDAVQAAVHYPAAAQMMGLTGRARLRLNYRDGSVDSPSVAQSSGTPMLDQAALKAAKGAHYPATPPALVGHLLPLLVWVEFRAG